MTSLWNHKWIDLNYSYVYGLFYPVSRHMHDTECTVHTRRFDFQPFWSKMVLITSHGQHAGSRECLQINQPTSNVSAVTSKMSVCTLRDCNINYPERLTTVKGFPNALIMAHSNSINQQGEGYYGQHGFWLLIICFDDFKPLAGTLFHTSERGNKVYL